MIRCDRCSFKDVFDDCTHTNLTGGRAVDRYVGGGRDGQYPVWCPRRPTKPKQENKREKTTMRDFNFDSSQVKNNAVSALDTTKDAIIQLQQGKAVLTAVKMGLKKAPGLPESVTAIMDTPYGDLLVGLILHTVAPILTGSPVVIKAVKAANVAGAAEISNNITFITDTIEAAIESIPGFGELQSMVGQEKEKEGSKYSQPGDPRKGY